MDVWSPMLLPGMMDAVCPLSVNGGVGGGTAFATAMAAGATKVARGEVEVGGKSVGWGGRGDGGCAFVDRGGMTGVRMGGGAVTAGGFEEGAGAGAGGRGNGNSAMRSAFSQQNVTNDVTCGEKGGRR